MAYSSQGNHTSELDFFNWLADWRGNMISKTLHQVYEIYKTINLGFVKILYFAGGSSALFEIYTRDKERIYSNQKYRDW